MQVRRWRSQPPGNHTIPPRLPSPESPLNTRPMVRKRIWRFTVLRSSITKRTMAEVESETTLSSACLLPSRISSAQGHLSMLSHA